MSNEVLIAIHGTYHDNNFGDLLLMKIYENWIKNITSSRIVYPMVPQAQLANFKSNFPDASIGLKNLRSWKGLIYAGGGHFGEPNSSAKNAYSKSWNKRFFKRHVLPAELCIWNNIPYGVIGVGAGPLSNFFVKHEVKRILANAKIRCVRDIDSQKFVNKTLNISSGVTVLPDAALSISQSDIPEKAFETINNLLEPYKEMLLLGIHHPRDFLQNTPQSESMRMGLLECLKSEPDVLPVVFSDNGNSKYSKHSEDLTKLISDFTGKKCLSLPFQGVWETVALISQFSAVLTTKLHVGIVAYALGVYCESFALHSKVKRFYQQVNRSSQCLMLNEADKTNSITKINRAIELSRNKVSIRDAEWHEIKQLAQQNQTLVASFLEKIR
ncbi:hypothetical protein NIES267_67910 [Calothrix parasitica NIES-267]|uniref:Polysaccharide pyruvyl transferase domain-containing protein n=1 Tax=Calothrix parasitica NIES-267 TaxID=1973488 RepID=A0A1Z4M1D0_9CYAN|nr:hypothetical protein NIES267_67910 [Calothrix parasitica NIES-267]